MTKTIKSKSINRRKDMLTVVAVVITAVVTFIGVSWALGSFTDSESLANEKIKLEKYLETKYGKDFTIKNAKIYIPFLDEEEVFEANIYPTDDSSQVVKVYRDVTNKNAGYQENYLGQVWQTQETPAIKNHLETLYTDKTMPKYNLQITASDEYVASVNGNTPSLKEALSTYGSKAAQIVLFIDQDKFKSDQNLDRAAGEIAKIASYVTKIDKEAGWSYTLLGDSKRYICGNRFVKGAGDHAALVKCLEKSEL